MHKTSAHKTKITSLPLEIVKVTRSQVRDRTRELALLAGRTPHEVLQADYDQAKCELTGESMPARQETLMDS